MPPKNRPNQTIELEPTEVGLAVRVEEIAGELQASKTETTVGLNLMNLKLEEVLKLLSAGLRQLEVPEVNVRETEVSSEQNNQVRDRIWNKTALPLGMRIRWLVLR